MIIFDTETVGYHGPIVLIQWAEDEGPIHLHEVWREPIGDTLELIERIVHHEGGVLGFNLAFDWFHLCQLYTTLLLLAQKVGRKALPEDHIDEYALLEADARDGPCLKPVKALDLMLFARKGPYQNTMDRSDILIRKVPTALAPLLASELERRVPLRDIFFAKRAEQHKNDPHWKAEPLKENPDWSNVILRFAPSSAMKALATDALGLDPAQTLVFADVEVDPKFIPVEHSFAPFATAIGRPGKWNKAWPEMIRHHINHWAFNPLARKYAHLDIVYPRELWKKWGCPELGDDDSTLACLSGAARWKGYALNVKGIKALRRKAKEKSKLAPTNRANVLKWLQAVMSEEERLALTDEHDKPSTKKMVLEAIEKDMKVEDGECPACKGQGTIAPIAAPCAACKGLGVKTKPHPAAIRAKAVLDARRAEKEVDLYDKLLIAGRFHVSLNVIGARSGRMSGGQVADKKRGRKSGSVNPQGIQKQKRVRAQFQLAFTDGMCRALGLVPSPGGDEEEILGGGDFDKFEVTIADAYYQDPQLHEDLTGREPSCDKNQCEGKCPRHKKGVEFGEPGSIKIHAVIGTLVYPGMSYWDIRMTEGKDRDLYTRAKSAFFALIYFGNAFTLKTRLDIDEEAGEKAYQSIMRRYPVMAAKRLEFQKLFCPMKQPGGIGTQVVWEEPAEFVESMLGFRRYFTLENQICRAVYNLANAPPKEWRDVKIRVMRREKMQTASGAVQSALFGAAFQLQGGNMRAAGNHKIQSTGAQLTKILQRRVWDIQKPGIRPWEVRPMNVHDELMCPHRRRVGKRIKEIHAKFLEEYRTLIPLIGMKWKNGITSWAGK